MTCEFLKHKCGSLPDFDQPLFASCYHNLNDRFFCNLELKTGSLGATGVPTPRSMRLLKWIMTNIDIFFLTNLSSKAHLW